MDNCKNFKCGRKCLWEGSHIQFTGARIVRLPGSMQLYKLCLRFEKQTAKKKKDKNSILSKSTWYKITLPLVLSRNVALEILFWYSLRVVVTDTEILCCGFEIDNLFSPDLCGRCSNAKEEKRDGTCWQPPLRGAQWWPFHMRWGKTERFKGTGKRMKIERIRRSYTSISRNTNIWL